MGLLKGKYTTYAEYEIRKLKELTRLNVISCEAVKDSSREVILITTQDGDKLILCLTTVNHQGQTHLYRPTYLFLEGFQLLLLELTTPIVVKTYLADGDSFRGERREERGVNNFLYLLQTAAPVATHLLGV